ncbi:hypothetical protein [Lysinibacillus capsici]|uniref:hypothetical protein n=1 Tax=Lysinibacillus capsici TaxID=2115968 RepID=UPI00325FA114
MQFLKNYPMRKSDYSITLYIPIVFCQLYLGCIYILALFGPWPWEFPNTAKLTLFIIVCNIGLLVGYFLAIKVYKVKKYNQNIDDMKIFNFFLIVFFITLPLTFYIRTNINLFNPIEFYNSLLLGIHNPAELYYNKLRFYESNSAAFSLTVIDILLTAVYYYVLAIAVFRWKYFSLIHKVTIFIGVTINMLSWVLIGTNKGLFDLMIILIIYIIYKISIIKKNSFSLLKIKNIISLMLIFFFIIGIFGYFANSIESRVGDIVYFNDTNIKIDTNSPIYKYTPDFLKGFIVTLSSYLTQGYYGLSLALEEPFTSTLFIGNSSFLSSFMESTFGISYFIENSYPTKIEIYGWDRFINWHTAYTWFASDISFWGVPFLMILIGFLLGVFWKESLAEQQLSMVLFIIIMILVIYIPANNQIFSFPGTLFTFYLFFSLRFLRKNLKIKF